jgi:hypothetical protein
VRWTDDVEAGESGWDGSSIKVMRVCKYVCMYV